MFPVPEFKRGGNTDPDNSLALLGRELARKLADAVLEKSEQLRGIGIRVGVVKLAAHGAQQIHDEQIHTAAADLEAKGESAVGRQGIGH